MERSREKLKDLLKGSAWGPDLVDTIFAISDRVGRSTKAAASGAAESVTTVVHSVAASIHWNRVTNKPTTFPPGPHTHPEYLTEELDPVFAASPAAGITAEEAALLRDELEARAGWSGMWGYTWH